MIHRLGHVAAIGAGLLMAGTAAGDNSLYDRTDFEMVRKIDAHVHANEEGHEFLDIARKDGFELLSINVDYPDFPPLDVQARVAHALRAADPRRFHFATTFSMKGFGSPGWAEETIRSIDSERHQGAVAVKVWKNIGMVEKDEAGRFIMLDDSGFDGVMKHIEDSGVPLIAHQAEPKNCWLPLDAMTTENDREYFREHPEYHMYLHPDLPGYEAILAARDRFVGRHPRLKFVGAHLASLEWSVDEVARFLDAYPNATVDLAARMTQVQYQSKTAYEDVRRFFVRYQDRLLYGSDLTQDPGAETGSFADDADRFWRSDWRYLATTEPQRIEAIKTDIIGLGLPKAIIDKIYFGNAQRVFGLTEHPG
jgi:predicted TIM-barrel fold metal-dependent hydrolase